MTIAHGLPHGDDVWNEVFAVCLEAPEVPPSSAKAYLDFISDKHAPCPANMSETQRYMWMSVPSTTQKRLLKAEKY